MFFGVGVATGIAVGVGNSGVTGVVVLVANGDVGSGVVFAASVGSSPGKDGNMIT